MISEVRGLSPAHPGPEATLVRDNLPPFLYARASSAEACRATRTCNASGCGSAKRSSISASLHPHAARYLRSTCGIGHTGTLFRSSRIMAAIKLLDSNHSPTLAGLLPSRSTTLVPDYPFDIAICIQMHDCI